MPKKILRVTIESIEVPDDYIAQKRNEAHENSLMMEYDGHLHVGGESGDQFYFIASDTSLNALSPVMQFVWWSSVAWQGFYGKVPEKIRIWLKRFVDYKSPVVTYAKYVHEKASRRRDEVETGMIHFKEWDAELFTRPEKLFSIH